MLPAAGRIWGISRARPLPGSAGGMQALHFEPENKRRRANLPRLGLGAGYVCHLCTFILGWDASCGTRGVGRSPGSPSPRVCSSCWHQGWLMAHLRWRIWHRFFPRQLGTSCAEAASEDMGLAASLGLRLFSPLAFARNTSPSWRSREASSFCSAQTGDFNWGNGLDGLKLVAENWLQIASGFLYRNLCVFLTPEPVSMLWDNLFSPKISPQSEW